MATVITNDSQMVPIWYKNLELIYLLRHKVNKTVLPGYVNFWSCIHETEKYEKLSKIRRATVAFDVVPNLRKSSNLNFYPVIQHLPKDSRTNYFDWSVSTVRDEQFESELSIAEMQSEYRDELE